MGMHTVFHKDDSMVITCLWPHEAYSVEKFKQTHPDLPKYIIFKNKGKAKDWVNEDQQNDRKD